MDGIKCALTCLLNNLLVLIETLIFSNIVESLFNLRIEIAMIIALILVVFFNYSLTKIRNQSKNNVLYNSKIEFVNSLFKNNCSFRQDSSNISKIIDEDIENVSLYGCDYLPNFIFGLISFAIYLMICFNKNQTYSFYILALCALQIIIPALMAKYFADDYEKTMAVEEEIHDYYFNIISKIHKAWHFCNDYFVNRLNEILIRYYKVGTKSELTAQTENALMGFLDVLSQFGLYFIGLILLSKNLIGLPVLTAMIVLAQSMIAEVQELSEIFKKISIKKISEKRINGIFENNCNLKLIDDFDQIDIQNVKYENVDNVFNENLKNHNLYLIKGENGSGKSTLIKSIINIVDEYEGQLKIDNSNVKDIDMSCLAYYVPQENALNNICVKELFDVFNLPDLQTKLQDNFEISEELLDKQIGECSSGEIKKINLIAAFLSNKPLLILDEPESSLDEKGVASLKKCLTSFDKTIIIATNRSIYDDLNPKVVNIND